ncbi:hypothetical protein EG68_02511 [Paragonimus skrjabini miyazakii]|uniref:Uncharacterized protein n=1 Tax=Paragonimus skrjabini miyazakii TaxID=59628 RepID=A0A8S9Z3L1_9TREM|nr:hypothetical protein EG68_02511 [Paragonimus skrjabini miyazakii]
MASNYTDLANRIIEVGDYHKTQNGTDHQGPAVNHASSLFAMAHRDTLLPESPWQPIRTTYIDALVSSLKAAKLNVSQNPEELTTCLGRAFCLQHGFVKTKDFILFSNVNQAENDTKNLSASMSKQDILVIVENAVKDALHKIHAFIPGTKTRNLSAVSTGYNRMFRQYCRRALQQYLTRVETSFLFENISLERSSALQIDRPINRTLTGQSFEGAQSTRSNTSSLSSQALSGSVERNIKNHQPPLIQLAIQHGGIRGWYND